VGGRVRPYALIFICPQIFNPTDKITRYRVDYCKHFCDLCFQDVIQLCRNPSCM